MKAPPFKPARGRMPTIEWLPIGELLIDASYQRSIDTNASEKLITAIAADWDWDLVDVLKVSRRPDEQLYVVDGQHRRAAAARRPDIPALPCVVKRCSGPNEEARLFIAANRGRKAMSRFDDHRAAVGAGDEIALTIERLAHEAGLSIANNAAATSLLPGQLLILSPLRSALKKRGEEAVGAALRLIGEAFPDEVITAASPLFGAILELLTIEKRDYDQLFEVLLQGGTTAEWAERSGVLSMKSGGMSRTIAMRQAIARGFAQREIAA